MLQSEAVISSIYDLLEEQQDKSHIANEVGTTTYMYETYNLPWWCS